MPNVQSDCFKTVSSGRLIGSRRALSRLQPSVQLPMFFVRFQIEQTVGIHLRHASILCLAAVAHQRVPHERVKQHVDQGRGEQNSKRPQQMSVVPGDGAANDPHGHDQHTQPLRKILTYKQIGARTNQTTLHPVAVNCILGHGQFLPTGVALQMPGVGSKMGPRPLVTSRACISDVHVNLSIGSLAACGLARNTHHYYSGNSDSRDSSNAMVSPTNVPITAT